MADRRSSNQGQGQGHEPRVRHPKVKTGCITCRNRRVKCDETRPSCLRCLKYGAQCSGYPAGRKRPPSSQYGSFASQARALVPKKAAKSQVLIQPLMALFETDQEHRYFQLFADRIAGEICPYFHAETWSRMILQACTAESSIRHAASAIGALGKAYEIAQAGQSTSGQRKQLDFDRLPAPGSSSAAKAERRNESEDSAGEELVKEAYTHHRHALEQYDKAIKKMRGDIASKNQSLRTTLIICIIITCFEAIHGNHESAAGHLLGGLAVIQEWKAEQKEAERHPQGFSSPAPDEVDDFLVQTFGRMEIHCMSVFDPRPIEAHDKLKSEGLEVVQQMPPVFNSIAQARIYLDLITRRLLHFNASIHDRRTCMPSAEPSDNANAPTKPIPWTSPDGSSPKPMPWIDGQNPDLGPMYSADLFDEQTSLNNELAAWTTTFKPLLTFSLAMGHQEAISALTLTISSIASQISLRAAFFTNEISFDVFLPEFRRIVEQSTILLETHKSFNILSSAQKRTESATSGVEGTGGPIMRFAFDIGVVPPLYLVIVKCRDRRLRRQALHLLEQYPRREGVWDSVATVALCKWVIRLEEEGAREMSMSLSPRTISAGGSPSSGSETLRSSSVGAREDLGGGEAGYEIEIPEEMRVRKTSMRFDLLLRTAWMNCLQMDLGTREFVPRNDVFTW